MQFIKLPTTTDGIDALDNFYT